MAEHSTSIRLAQSLGITSSAFLAGSIFTYSYGAVPALLRAPPSLLVQQWRTMYDRGKMVLPPLALAAGLELGFLAYRDYQIHHGLKTLLAPSHKPVWRLYALAGAAVLSIVPYTLVVMANVNRRLAAKAEEARELAATTATAGEEDNSLKMMFDRVSTKQLLDWWGVLNLGRAALPLVGAGLATWATFA